MDFSIQHIGELTRQIERVAVALENDLEWRKSHAGLATKHDLHEMEQKIMAKISELPAILNAVSDKVDAMTTGQAAVAAELTKISTEIQTLQTSLSDVELPQAAADSLARLTASVDAATTASNTVAENAKAADDLIPDAAP